MSPAAFEMDAEMAVKIVARDALTGMGHPVHGGRYISSVYIYNDGFPAPAPGTTVDFFHDSGILCRPRLSVGMVATAIALNFKAQAGGDISYCGDGAPAENVPGLGPFQIFAVFTAFRFGRLRRLRWGWICVVLGGGGIS